MQSLLPGLGPVGVIPIVGQVIGLVVGIVSIFTGLFGGGSSNTDAQINNLKTQVGQLGHDLGRFIWSIGFAFGLLLQWAHDLLVGWMQSIWSLLKKVAHVVEYLLKDIIPRLLRMIKNLRTLLNGLYQKYIRPALVWIQYARKWLAILRLFHVKWAGALDAWLVKLQGRIIGPYLYALRTLNGIGTWVNLIVTAGGVLQRATFVNTMYAYQRDWVNLWWVGQSIPGGAVVPPNAAPPVLPPTQPQVTADFTTYVQSDTGPYAAVATRAQQLVGAAG